MGTRETYEYMSLQDLDTVAPRHFLILMLAITRLLNTGGLSFEEFITFVTMRQINGKVNKAYIPPYIDPLEARAFLLDYFYTDRDALRQAEEDLRQLLRNTSKLPTGEVPQDLIDTASPDEST